MMKNVESLEKKPRFLKIVKETLRDLDPDRLSTVAGGTIIVQITSLSRSEDR